MYFVDSDDIGGKVYDLDDESLFNESLLFILFLLLLLLLFSLLTLLFPLLLFNEDIGLCFYLILSITDFR